MDNLDQPHTVEQLRNGELTGLTHLTLSEKLTDFPREIFSLAETLEVLDLSNNLLTDLPADLSRLTKLRILFCSNNRFTHLPEGLGVCDSLEMVGFKHNQITEVSENSLSENLRWLILTDNQITKLPEKLGELYRLEKLMLTGNRLTQLPESIARCKSLALLRISANQLTDFPYLLLSLPRLAWLAFSGNPFCEERDEHADVQTISSDQLEWGDVLGKGASGVIFRAAWKATEENNLITTHDDVAVKVFRGQVTSDGYPQDELDACLSVGHHQNIVKPLAKIAEENQSSLIMELIPETFRNLGQPPTFETCSRDTFTQDQRFSIAEIQNIIAQMDSVMAHLKAKRISHGDLYAHNVLIDPDGRILFGDFGAASKYDVLPMYQQHGIQRIEQRAMTHFIEDMLGLCNDEDKQTDAYYDLKRRMFNIG
ncbi:leucine-rich repeat-containing protein kinase family protein [Marinomonas sp. 2405UD68-3]|uniref:leucine-rich repeat-containing protein kinase family protein n=1 Tax=Marinomonas sp. 2405UD68-3 TaxID=3391835 RepID=UPI0039C8FDFB